jgi:hypothetical protein
LNEHAIVARWLGREPAAPSVDVAPAIRARVSELRAAREQEELALSGERRKRAVETHKGWLTALRDTAFGMHS